MEIHVLAIDDESVHSLLINKILNRIRHVKVTSCGDAFEGYAALCALDNVDVVVVDYNMPYVDGLAFLRKLRSHDRFKSTAAVLISGDERAQEKVSGFERMEALHKPFKPDALVEAVERLAASNNV